MRLVFLLLVVAGVLWASQPFSRPQQVDAADTVRVFVELTGGYQNSDWNEVRTIGAQPRHLFAAVGTISLDIPEYLIPVLERSRRVKVVRPVPLVAVVEDMLPWGIDTVDAERVWGGAENAVNVATGANSGAGVRVAVIDTGIAAHSDLNIVGGASFVAGVSSYNDGNGHGTHVAGTIAARDNGTGVLGIAPGANLLAVKVLSDSGGGYLDDVAAGIEWSTQNGARVINMSLSCSGSSLCDDPVMNSAMQMAANAGVVIVAAAGNAGSGSNTVGWPAQSPLAIAVAATTSTNARASYSSTGPAVEIAAPGHEIFSTYLNGSFATMSGTSMAAPHVAGAAALLVNCGYSASQIRSVLTSTADELGTSGRDNLYGHGLLDVDQAASCGGGAVQPPPPPTGGPTSVTETFESGNWSGGTGWTAGSWTRSGSTSYSTVTTSSGPQSGSRHVQLRANAGITRTLNLSGMTNPTLTFWSKGSSWESSDRASVQVSTNGSSWTTLATYSNTSGYTTYQQRQFSLSQWAGQSTLYMRFLGQMSASSDYFYLDSITIAGGSGVASEPTPTHTPTPGNSPTATRTPTPVPSATATNTPRPPTATPTRTPTPVPTATNTPSSGGGGGSRGGGWRR